MRCRYCQGRMHITWSDEYGDTLECEFCGHEEWVEYTFFESRRTAEMTAHEIRRISNREAYICEFGCPFA